MDKPAQNINIQQIISDILGRPTPRVATPYQTKDPILQQRMSEAQAREWARTAGGVMGLFTGGREPEIAEKYLP